MISLWLGKAAGGCTLSRVRWHQGNAHAVPLYSFSSFPSRFDLEADEVPKEPQMRAYLGSSDVVQVMQYPKIREV